MPYTSDFLAEVKQLVKSKLNELGAFADEELPDYIMVMVANKKKPESMKQDLNLFLGSQTEAFTEWLSGLLESQSSSKNSRRDSGERSSSKHTKSHKREKSHHSTDTLRGKRSRSRSPIAMTVGNVDDGDVIQIKTDENEFNEESLNDPPTVSKSAKTSEHRRVVSTSSITGKQTRKSEDSSSHVRSVVKTPPLKTKRHETDANRAPTGMLLKRAMNDVQAAAPKPTSRPSAIVYAQKRTIQDVRVEGADDNAVTGKETRFVVRIDKPAPTSTSSAKGSVKSRLGPRVQTTNSDSEDCEKPLPGDAREILLAKKVAKSGGDDLCLSKKRRMEITLDESREEIEESSGDEENQEDDDDMKGNRDHIPSSLQRCKYWPSCRNGDTCQFMHPKEECKSFPNCRFGDRCMYIHPPCRYGHACTRPGCSFSHAGQAFSPISVAPRMAASSQPTCRYFPHCKLPAGTCPFYHPPTPVCRFGAACLHRATTCPFAHPLPAAGDGPSAAGAVISPKSFTPRGDKFKWVAPGKAVAPVGSPPSTSVAVKSPLKTRANQPSSAEVST